MATTTAVVSAQTPPLSEAAAEGTCADLGMSVVEPLSVSWASDSSPVLNPSYMWAYGDVDVLWDNATDEYWFHWYNAVPGPDAYVVYEFESGTTIEGVQFTNDWSSGDLQLQGMNGAGQAVGGINVVPLSNPFVSYVDQLNSMTVASVKMTTSTQQVKLLELDFCGEADPSELDLSVSTETCESITASWNQQPGANHQISVDGGNTQVSEGGLSNSYTLSDLDPGVYTVTVTAGSLSETLTVTVTDCDVGPTCGSTNDPADAHCASVNVIESFGDAPLPLGEDGGMPWNIISDYYDEYGDRSGMCSIDVHNSYWTAVRAADGGLTYYPSWHPPVHDPDGPQECRMTHEHGIDPADSDLYDEDHPTNIGVPFGFVHAGNLDGSNRTEDHVGHKVVVANNFKLTKNNPYQSGTQTLNLFIKDGGTVTCDWYSKLHQGTHGPDALGFSMHEYFLNYSCDDDTEIRVKEMTDFGFESHLNDDQANDPDPTELEVVDLPDFPLTGGFGTVSSGCGWFATNFPGPVSDPDPSDDSDFGDAGRGFSCLMSDAKIEELWKPSASISAPDDGPSVEYDPYYLVMNPNRYGLYEWWEYLEQDGDFVGEHAMISMIDFCVEGSELRNELTRPDAPGNFVKSGWGHSDPFRVQTYCSSVDVSALDQWAADIAAAGGDTEALMLERKESVDNVFLGTRRGVHTKGPRIWGGGANFKSLAFFCSDHLGNDSDWPTDPTTGNPVTDGDPWAPGDPTPICNNGVPQLLSVDTNGHVVVEGSTAGAISSGGTYQSQGPAMEIIIDMDERYPDHGIQAPN